MTYLVLNPKTLDTDIAAIKKHVEKPNSFVVFIEVTNKKVADKFAMPFSVPGSKASTYDNCYFIDPQHSYSGVPGDLLEPQDFNKPTSAIKYTYCNSQLIFNAVPPNSDILYVIEKPDMDSIGALTLCKWILESTNGDILLTSDEVARINDIHNVDCWVMPTEWNPDHIQEFTIKWTNILGACISDRNLPIEEKIRWMETFILKGKLPEQYKTQVEAEYQLLQQATIETLNGITVVTSQARGASGLIYKQSPYGIAYSKNFNGKGEKFSVMQFKSGYIDLARFWGHMNTNYPESSGTWGGGANAGGSPIPCKLSKELVAAELAKFIITTPVVNYPESNVC